jgi:hypothetical protein
VFRKYIVRIPAALNVILVVRTTTNNCSGEYCVSTPPWNIPRLSPTNYNASFHSAQNILRCFKMSCSFAAFRKQSTWYFASRKRNHWKRNDIHFTDGYRTKSGGEPWACDGRTTSGVQKSYVTRESLCSVHLTKCYSGNQIRSMRWARHIACMGDRRGAYRVLVGKSKGERPLESLRHRLQNDIKKHI